MPIFEYPPEQRIFHIDDECYIIYLGSDVDDYKPFLRIGNSKMLTKEIISYIYNIVISDSFTGDPSLEPENINRENINENRYVGDKNLVERFLIFLNNFGVATNEISHLQEFITENRKAMLFIYDNGNIKLLFDGRPIFDLKEREKRDNHFLQKCILVKEWFTKYPLKYKKELFKEPGFFMAGNNLFFFNQSEIVCFSIPDSYFNLLAKKGIDPDLITSIITDKIHRGLFDFLKRKRFLKQKVFLITENKKQVTDAVQLFSLKKGEGFQAEVKFLEKSSPQIFYGGKVQKHEAGYNIFLDSLKYPIFITFEKNLKIKEENIFINLKKGRFQFPGNKKGKTWDIADGLPYRIIMNFPDDKELIDKYFTRLSESAKNILGPIETAFLLQLEQLVENLKNINITEELAVKYHKSLKKSRAKIDGPLYFIILNLSQIITLLTGKSWKGQKLEVRLKSLSSFLEEKVRDKKIDNPVLPLIGDFYISEEKPLLLYRLAMEGAGKEELSIGLESIKEIEKKLIPDHSFHLQEIQRLSAFIEELSRISKQPLPPFPGKEKPKKHEPEPYEKIAEVIPAGEVTPMVRRKKRIGLNVLYIAGIFTFLIALILLLPVSPFYILEKAQLSKREIKPEQTEMIIEKKIISEETSLEGETPPTEKETGRKEISLVKPEREISSIQEEETSKPLSPEQAFEKTSSEEIPGISREWLEEFLDLGDIKITVLDVYILTNTIAKKNGYRELDSPVQLGKDPNWIYPGNLFTLPDGEEYTVLKGDTIWHIAKNFIKEQIEKQRKLCQNILKDIDKTTKKVDNEIIRKLVDLRDSSFSSNFRKEIDKKIAEIRSK